MTDIAYIQTMTSVAIIEDDSEIRGAIRDFLNTRSDIACETAVGSVEEFLKHLQDGEQPDVVLSDIGLPGMSGIDGLRLIKEFRPEADIIMLTVYNDSERIFQALCAGASGYLLKNTPFQKIAEGILMLHNGGAPMSPEIAGKVISYFQRPNPAPAPSPLTPKEREVVVGLVDGLSYKMIADRMGISLQTVQVHIKNTYRKLQAHSKAEVIARAVRGEI
jgi:DNA-binding NarL/FixJ family response regulator